MAVHDPVPFLQSTSMAWLVIMYGADTEPLHAPAATTTPTLYTFTTTTLDLNRYQSIEIIAIAKKKRCNTTAK